MSTFDEDFQRARVAAKAGPISKNEDFRSRLKGALRPLTEEYFGDDDFTNWSHGGCWLLAEALRLIFGGKLFAFVSRIGLEHVVLCLPDGRFVDTNGIQDRKELESDHRGEGKLVPFTKKQQQEIKNTGGEGKLYSSAVIPYDAPQLAEQIASRVNPG
jgi:hypothetical protein